MKKLFLLFIFLFNPFYIPAMERDAIIRNGRQHLITLGIGALNGTLFNLSSPNFLIQNIGGASFTYLTYLAINSFLEMREGRPFNGEIIVKFGNQEKLLLVAYVCTVLSMRTINYMLSEKDKKN